MSIVKNFEKEVGDKLLALKIEKGIYNYVIEKSKEKNIKRFCSNRIFKDFYLNKIMSIYSYSLQGKRDSNEDKHVHYINVLWS